MAEEYSLADKFSPRVNPQLPLTPAPDEPEEEESLADKFSPRTKQAKAPIETTPEEPEEIKPYQEKDAPVGILLDKPEEQRDIRLAIQDSMKTLDSELKSLASNPDMSIEWAGKVLDNFAKRRKHAGGYSAIETGLLSLKNTAVNIWEGLNKQPYTEPERTTEAPISDWWDEQNNVIKDVPKFLKASLPEEQKSKLVNKVLSAYYGIPEADVAKGRYAGAAEGGIAGALAKADAVITGELVGKIASVVGNRNQAVPSRPPDFLTPEANKYVENTPGGTVQIGQLEIDVPDDPTMNPIERKEVMWRNYVAAVRDLKFEAERSSIYDNLGLPLMIAGGIKSGAVAAQKAAGELPSIAGRLTSALVDVANPLSAGLEKLGVRLGGTAGKVVGSTPSKILGSATEAVVQSMPSEQEKTWGRRAEEAIFPAIVGGGTHAIGEGISRVFNGKERAIYDPIEQNKIIAKEEAVNILQNSTPEQIDAIVKGDAVVESAIEGINPSDVREQVVAISNLRKMTTDIDFNERSMEEIFSNMMNDPVMINHLDNQVLVTEGISISQKADQLALRRMAKELDTAPQREAANKLFDSTEVKALLGDPEKIIEYLRRSSTSEEMAARSANAFAEARGYYDDPKNIRQSVFIDTLRTALHEASDSVADYVDISPRQSRLMQSVIRMTERMPGYLDIASRWKDAVDLEAAQRVKLNSTFEKLSNREAEGNIKDARIDNLLAVVSQALDETGEAIPGKYFAPALTELAKDYEMPIFDQLKRDIVNFNKAKYAQKKAQQDMIDRSAKNTFINNARHSIETKKGGGYDILRFATQNTGEGFVDLTLSRLMNPLLRNQNIHPETSAASDGFINEMAISIKNGKPIYEGVIDKYKLAVEKSKGVMGVTGLRDFIFAAEQWNRELRALDALGQSINSITADNADAIMKLIPAMRQASSDIMTEVNLKRLEFHQGAASDIFHHAMENSSLPETMKVQLFEMLFGSAETQMKLALDPSFPVATPTHAANMVRNTINYTKQMLDRVDQLHMEAFGTKLDREMFVSVLVNPTNFNNSSRQFESLFGDIARIKSYAKDWNKTSAELHNAWVNSETLENKQVTDIRIATGDYMEAHTQAFREANSYIVENFTGDLNEFLDRMMGMWKTQGFEDAWHKLNGNVSIAGLYEPFYLHTAQGKIKLTDNGRLHQYIFNNPSLFEEFKTYVSNGDVLKGTALIEKAMDIVFSTPEKIKLFQNGDGKPDSFYKGNYLNHFYNYFSDNILQSPKVDSRMWKDVWGAIVTVQKFRGKGYQAYLSILAEKNAAYKSAGISIKPIAYREDYLYTRLDSSFRLEDFMNNIYDESDNLSRHFGSSMQGQLSKPNAWDSASGSKPKLMHPALAAVHDVQLMIRNAHTAHTEVKIKEYGYLAKDLGFEAQSRAMTTFLQANMMMNKHPVVRAMRDIKNIFSLEPLQQMKYLREVMPYVNIFTGMIGRHMPIIALSSPSSLARTIHSQFIQTALNTMGTTPSLKGTAKVVGLPVFYLRDLWRIARTATSSNYNPFGALISDEGIRQVGIALKGYKDNVARSHVMMIDRLARGAEYGEGLPFTGKIRKALGMPERGISAVTAVGLRAERGVNQLAEFVTANLKERVELALSKTTLMNGMVLYEKAVNMVRNTGRDNTFKAIKHFFHTKADATVWRLVNRIEDSIKSGNPYDAAQEFLRIYHLNAVGRFGPMSSPLFVMYMAPLFPMATRFFGPKTMNLYRAGKGTVDMVEQAGVWTQSTWKTKLPTATSGRLFYSIVLGAGTWLLLDFIKDGFPMPETVKEAQSSDEDATVIQTLIHGIGANITRIAPIDYNDWKDVAKIFQGDALSAGEAVMDNILSVQGKRGRLFAGPEYFAVAKGIRDLYNASGERFPSLGIISSKMDKLEAKGRELNKELDKANNLAIEFESDPQKHRDVEAIEAAIAVNEEAKHQLTLKYNKEWGRAMADVVIQNSPVTGWIAYANNPVTVALMFKDLAARDALEGAIRDERGTKDYAGTLSTLFQFLGVQRKDVIDIDVMRQLYQAWYAPLIKEGVTKDQINHLAEFALSIDQSLNAIDEFTNYLHKSKLTEGEEFLQGIKEKINKRGIPYVKMEKPTPIPFESSPLDDVDLRKLPKRNTK